MNSPEILFCSPALGEAPPLLLQRYFAKFWKSKQSEARSTVPGSPQSIKSQSKTIYVPVQYTKDEIRCSEQNDLQNRNSTPSIKSGVQEQSHLVYGDSIQSIKSGVQERLQKHRAEGRIVPHTSSLSLLVHRGGV